VAKFVSIFDVVVTVGLKVVGALIDVFLKKNFSSLTIEQSLYQSTLLCNCEHKPMCEMKALKTARYH